METQIMLVSRYDFTHYEQAMRLAQAQYRQDGDWDAYRARLKAAYDEMMQSPDIETVEVQHYTQTD